MFKVESYATRGPAFGEGDKYQKLNIEKTDDATLSIKVTNGWIAGMQHHFVSAVVPDHESPHTFTMGVKGREYVLTSLGEVQTVAPGTTKVVKETLFVGSEAAEAARDAASGTQPRRGLRRPHADFAGRCSGCSIMRTRSSRTGASRSSS